MTRRLFLEPFEERDVPSVSAVLSRGVLTVTGDDNANYITLSKINNNLKVSTNSNQSWTFPISSLSRIVGDLRGGSDNWSGLMSGLLSVPQSIRGGAGNDAITTSKGNDTVYGDAGNDTLIPWAGTDIAYGGDNDDTILLSNGETSTSGYARDVAYGGNGNDRITVGSKGSGYGESGNDTMTSSSISFAGGAYLNGGGDNDTFFAYTGINHAHDTLVGESGTDRLASYDQRPGGGVDEFLLSIEVIG